MDTIAKPLMPASLRRTLRCLLVASLAFLAHAPLFGSGFVRGDLELLACAAGRADLAPDAGAWLADGRWVLGMSLRHRAGAALLKGFSMGLFGLVVLGSALWSFSQGTVPEATMMGAVGALALLANVAVAALLYAWREGDANMRSVWLCSRNDAIGNVAVIAAASGVFATGSACPDLAVAAVMAALALSAAWRVIGQARQELARVGAVGASLPAE